MQIAFFLLTVAVLLAFNALVAHVLAWLLTEVVHPVINVKPFNCRGCLSFWLSLVGSVVWAVEINKYLLPPVDRVAGVIIFAGVVFIGGLTGIINHLYIQLKFKINE